MRVKVLAAVLVAGIGTPLAAAEDLSEVYPATLDYVDKDEARGLGWTIEDNDVWAINRFDVSVGKDLKIRFGRGHLVVAHHDQNAVWAVVLPDRPAKVSASGAGDGEKVAHAYLRFHPSKIGELFPASVIKGNGPPEMQIRAYRIHQRKAGAHWSKGGSPIVPPTDTFVLDVDMEDGVRRVYDIDFGTERVEYQGKWVAHGVPAAAPIEKKEAMAVLDAVSETIAREYAALTATVGEEWPSLTSKYRREAGKAPDVFEVGIAIHGLLGHLEDPNIWVRAGKDYLPGFEGEPVILNANWLGVNTIFGDVTNRGGGIHTARTPHDVGYLAVANMSDKSVESVDEALESLCDTWALVVDLRFLNSGSESAAERIAGRFVPESVTYAYEVGIVGEVDTDSGTPLELIARGDWCYDGPIYLVLGPGTNGPGERLALMLQQSPKVTVLGAPTAGSSLDAEWFDLPQNFAVYVPKGRYVDAEHEKFMGVGIAVDVPIEAPEEIEEDEDPVLYKTLEEVLKTPWEERIKVREKEAEDSEEESAEEEPAEGT